MVRGTLIILFTLGNIALSYSDNIKYYTLKLEDGLNSNTVYSGIQSKINYKYWFATSNGLVSFDGLKFNHYEKEIYSFGISTLNVLEDGKGNIFSLTINGDITCYNGSQFITIRLKDKVSNDIFNHGVAKIYINNNNTINIIFIDKNRIIHCYNLCLNSDFSLRLYKKSLIVKKLRNFDLYYVSDICIAIVNSCTGEMLHKIENSANLFFNKKSIFKLNRNDILDSIFSSNSLSIVSVQYVNNVFYVSSTSGIYILRDGRLSPLISSKLFVSSILIDNQRNLLILTQNNGIIIKPNYEIKVLDLISNGISNFKYYNNFIYFLDNSYNLKKYNFKTSRSEILNYNNSNYSDQSIYISKDKIFANKKAINLNNNCVNPVNFIPFRELCINNKKYFLSTGYDDVKIVNYETKEYYTIYRGSRIFDALIQNKNDLWIASKNGLIVSKMDRCNTCMSRPYRIYFEGSQIKNLTNINGRVMFIKDHKSLIILNSNGEYLNLINQSIIHGQTINDYLVKGNKLYISTNIGLFISTLSEDYSSILRSHLLINPLGIKCEPVFNLELVDNSIMYTNGENIMIYSIDDIDFRDSLEYFRFDYYKIGKRYIKNESRLKSEVIVPPQEKIVIFSFSNSFFGKSVYHNQFLYKLIYNEEKIVEKIENSGELKFENLKSGAYTLMVYTRSKDFSWTSPYIVEFNVQPEFIETNLFSAILSVLVLLFILFANWLLQKNRKREILLNNLIVENENVRLHLLKSQLNPHFLFNAINSLKSLLYKDRFEKAITYSDNISHFLRSVLSVHQAMEVSIEKELELVSNYIAIENVRLGNRVLLQIQLDKGVSDFLIPSNILQPILENSIKYGITSAETELSILLKITLHEDYIVISLQDNGKGIIGDSGKQGNSFSIQSLKKRISSFNAGKPSQSVELEPIYSNGIKTGTLTTISLRVKTPKPRISN